MKHQIQTMKKIVYCLGLLLSFAVLPTAKGKEGRVDPAVAPPISYLPIPPLPITVTPAPGVALTFPNTDLRMVLNAFDAAGKVAYGVGKADGTFARYEQIVDYTKYFVMPLNMGDGYAFLHVGFVYRATANFSVNKGSIDTGSLFALSAQASASKIKGNIAFALYGLKSSEAHSSLPTPDALSQEKVEEYFRSLAVVKYIATQTGAASQIEPQIIAIAPNGYPLKDIIAKLYATKEVANLDTGVKIKAL